MIGPFVSTTMTFSLGGEIHTYRIVHFRYYCIWTGLRQERQGIPLCFNIKITLEMFKQPVVLQYNKTAHTLSALREFSQWSCYQRHFRSPGLLNFNPYSTLSVHSEISPAAHIRSHFLNDVGLHLTSVKASKVFWGVEREGIWGAL